MTNYQRANETQRNDPALRAAILSELKIHLEYLKIALTHTKAAKEAVYFLTNDFNSVSEARYSLNKTINSFNWQVQFLTKMLNDPDTYVGNKAAFMSAEEAARLKEKYSENSTD